MAKVNKQRPPTTTKELKARIQALGYTVVPREHPVILRPNGTRLMTISGSPGSDQQVKNNWARFLRNTKKEAR